MVRRPGAWLLSHLKRGVRGGRRFVLDKQAMFAYLPSALLPFLVFNVSFAYF
jgi:hypothetical protein